MFFSLGALIIHINQLSIVDELECIGLMEIHVVKYEVNLCNIGLTMRTCDLTIQIRKSFKFSTVQFSIKWSAKGMT